MEHDNPPLRALIEARLTRRAALKSGLALAAAGLLGMPASARAEGPSSLGFSGLPNVIDVDHAVAPGHRAEVLIRWGDPVLGDAPPFTPHALDADAQARQFGMNNDFIGYFPLPAGSGSSDHGLLCVNHEYCSPQLMFTDTKYAECKSAAQAAVEMAASGHSVIEVQKVDGRWRVVQNSRYARRLTAHTEMRVEGPAAGHKRLQTSADSSGRRVYGTINNCAGGVTPWGTVLIAEENFDKYFTGDADQCAEAAALDRYGFRWPDYPWGQYIDRFDLQKEPHEANRFGWIVELDPYDPTAVPVKRTALGRFKHEGATCVLNPDGRVVVYSGDDDKFEYVYKYVSAERYDPDDRHANRELLDNGTLFVARFAASGTCQWLPLVWGTGPLTPVHGFASQADVMIEARRAADLLGATPLDRPEDVETNPVNQKVYVALTNNSSRKDDQVDAANPRGPNRHGHILELEPPEGDGGRDHAALNFSWNVFLLGGDPAQPEHRALYHPRVDEDGWLSCPDNVAFDPGGRIWISTDGAQKSGIPDGLRAADCDGPGRALTRLFYAAPAGAELCGPRFTPDGRTLFVAVQHPGAGGSFDEPKTRWPDFDDENKIPPRPSVVVITRDDGGPIG